MEIKELTSNTLSIVNRKSWPTRIINFSAGSLSVVFAISVAIWGGNETPTGEHAAYAPLVLVFIVLVLLAVAFFLIAPTFDVTTYRFDKAGDRFLLRGRRLIFKGWAAKGPVSGITGVSCEVRGVDEHAYSEICLTYSDGGVVTETIKCGTGEVQEDESITDTINTFLELGKGRGASLAKK